MKQFFSSPKALLTVCVVLVVVAAAPSIYFYMQYRQIQLQLQDPAGATKQEAQGLVATISKFMDLPSNETPTIATVTDSKKVANQPFFAHAQNGDKVIIYTNAKKAILYRPSINKIIEVGPVSLGTAATSTPSAQAANQIYNIALRNGTDIVGLTKTFEAALKSKIGNVTIVDRDNAAKQDYTNSVLIDLKGNVQAASDLAAVLGISQSTLPKGEASSSADFLIIVGTDKK